MFQKNEWELFLGTATDSGNESHPPSWCPAISQEKYKIFSSNFPAMVSNLNFQAGGWREWLKSPNCESKFPQEADSISEFQKVLLIQIFRPERLETCLNNFSQKAFNNIESFTSNFSFGRVYKEQSSPSVPILFIISGGSDPSRELEEHATKTIGKEKFLGLALGGNQNDQALQLLKTGAENGCWVF